MLARGIRRGRHPLLSMPRVLHFSDKNVLPPSKEEEDNDDDVEMYTKGPSGVEWGGPTRGGKYKEPTRFGGIK